VLKRKVKKKIAIIGNKSFIQDNLFEYLKKKFNVKKIKFQNIKKLNLSKIDYVINCSSNKNFFDKNYEKKYDRNYILSTLIIKQNVKLIMLSSRQVYEPKINITEKSKIKPVNLYAKNCIKSEINCKNILNKRLIILRLSNIFGYEVGKKKKPSLVSIFISGLKQKHVTFDNNYYLYKDFLPINYLSKYMYRILLKDNFSGILNVGSGIPLRVYNFLKKLMNNQKITIRIILKNNFNDKNFSFNTKKLKKITGINLKKKQIYLELKKLNLKLKKYYD
jgi:nucleoside-diphosphate-sugar epimerase